MKSLKMCQSDKYSNRSNFLLLHFDWYAAEGNRVESNRVPVLVFKGSAKTQCLNPPILITLPLWLTTKPLISLCGCMILNSILYLVSYLPLCQGDFFLARRGGMGKNFPWLEWRLKDGFLPEIMWSLDKLTSLCPVICNTIQGCSEGIKGTTKKERVKKKKKGRMLFQECMEKQKNEDLSLSWAHMGIMGKRSFNNIKVLTGSFVLFYSFCHTDKHICGRWNMRIKL